LSFLLLKACSAKQNTESVFENYLYRLSNSLEVDNKWKDENWLNLNAVTNDTLDFYPKKFDVEHVIPPSTVNILQFMQISQCDLQRLIGYKNSSLGKLMDSYQILLYEYEFLSLAKDCKNHLNRSENSYTLLEEMISYKTNYLKYYYWNGVFGSQEFSQLFSLGSKPLTIQALENKPADLLEALVYINQWLLKPSLDREQLSQAFESIAASKYIGELRLTMALSINALSAANEMMSIRIDQKPLCRNNKPGPQFEVVETVFRKFYIGETQISLAKLYQQVKILFGQINQLQTQLEPTQGFIKFWSGIYLSENSEWNQFNQAVDKHTKQWQALLKQCGRLPT
jgi:hypothetical protein